MNAVAPSSPEPRGRSAPAIATWIAASTVLLTLAFLGYVYLAARVAASSADPADVREIQVALVLYARVVLVKGLLPQLLLAFAIWPLLARVPGLGQRGRGGLLMRALASAAIANAVVVSTVLTSDLFELPAVKFSGAWNTARTCAEMTAAVAAALALPRLLRR